MKNQIRLASAIVLVLALSACGPDSVSVDNTSETPKVAVNSTDNNQNSSETKNNNLSIIRGQLVDSPVEGVKYICGDKTEGFTDEEGRFECKELPVKFKVGNITIGEIKALPEDKVVTPQDLSGVERDNYDDKNVCNIARLLQSLDDDGDINNSITIDDEIAQNLEDVNITDLKEEQLNEILEDAGADMVVPVEKAIKHLKEHIEQIIKMDLGDDCGFIFDGCGADNNQDVDNNQKEGENSDKNEDENRSDSETDSGDVYIDGGKIKFGHKKPTTTPTTPTPEPKNQTPEPPKVEKPENPIIPPKVDMTPPAGETPDDNMPTITPPKVDMTPPVGETPDDNMPTMTPPVTETTPDMPDSSKPKLDNPEKDRPRVDIIDDKKDDESSKKDRDDSEKKGMDEESNKTQDSSVEQKDEQKGEHKKLFVLKESEGIAVDNKSGTIWQNSKIGHGTRDEAIDFCKNLTLAGVSNWRLPTSAESKRFHQKMNEQGSTPIQMFDRCVAEVTTDGYIKTQKGAEKYGGEAGDSINFQGGANIRCISDDKSDLNSFTNDDEVSTEKN